MEKEPSQPSEQSWRFVRELRAPLHTPIVWRRGRPHRNEAELDKGCRLDFEFPDPAGCLTTAYADFRRFLRMGKVGRSDAFRITTGLIKTALPETHRIEADRRQCRILAGDTEGIRRGLVWVEDQMLCNGGPFLQCSIIERRPVIRTRISRCFFGPIHRPPKNRDELLDQVNYYPDEYLNRLAHEGVNGLWLTIHFSEICRQSVIREYGRHVRARLEKLRLTVQRCARYGIKIFLFANEPAPLALDGPVARAHPELAGNRMGGGRCYFCTSNPTAQRYLEDALRNLFADVPGLGGLINISIGEGGSHCWSGSLEKNTCPVCSQRQPYEVLNGALSAMERGMHASNPAAELISWPYTQYHHWGDKLTVNSAGRLPAGVILQQNFESSAEAVQCGRRHKLFDYWLSYIGPSKNFADCAKAAARNGSRMFAKLQVGCSHEAATTPYVPVPGNLYRKYRAMHKLGVSGVMQCWYFGNYPGLMTKAAGDLAFAPLAAAEKSFLLETARRDWGDDARLVARAWEHFQRGYGNFPLNHMFGWYGPMHDAPVWPLHLTPVDERIAPTWQVASQLTGKPLPASGDRIGECFGYSHTLSEILKLCRALSLSWNQGVAILRRLRPRYAANRERRRDIGVAEALGIQFESGGNMLNFYAMREELPYLAKSRQLRQLAAMRKIVRRELTLDARLIELCRADSRLGFHSEAEGYKYFPAKIKWRMRQLTRLLKHEFPQVEARIGAGSKLWPAYTGMRPRGRIYHCRPVKSGAPCRRAGWHGWAGRESAELNPPLVEINGVPEGHEKQAAAGYRAVRTAWQACQDGRILYVKIICSMPGGAGKADEDEADIFIEPRRLWPRVGCAIFRDGRHCFSGRNPYYYSFRRLTWGFEHAAGRNEWRAVIAVPLLSIREKLRLDRPLRIDVKRRIRIGAAIITQNWIRQHPLEAGLGYGTANPADMGWLVLDRG